MANQQRSVIVTAIILAVILGGALVWLLNRTPADQLTTQAPTNDGSSQNTDQTGDQQGLVPISDGSELAQAQQQTTTGLSPTEPGLTQQTSTTGNVQGVSTTAATGLETLPLLASLTATILGGGGLLASLKRFSR